MVIRAVEHDDLDVIAALLGVELPDYLRRARTSSLSSLLLTSTIGLVETVGGHRNIVSVAFFGTRPEVVAELTCLPATSSTSWVVLEFGPSCPALLAALFQWMARVDRIAMVATLSSSSLAALMAPVASNNDNAVDVRVVERDALMGSYGTRLAQIEDFDDLSPIFEAQSDVLTQTYGEFFLAELIETRNEQNQAFVLVHNDRPIGLACVTTEIAANQLDEVFDLRAFPDCNASTSACITLCCIDRQHEWRSKALLEAVFSYYSSRTYVIMSLPAAAEAITLLDEFQLVRVRESVAFDHVLYVCHRATVMHPPVVTIAGPDDAAAIAGFTATASGAVQDGVRDGRACIVRFAGDCLGVVVCSRRLTPAELDALSDHYDIDDIVAGPDTRAAHIESVLISPALHGWRRHVFLDVCNLLDLQVLFYVAQHGQPVLDVHDLLVDAGHRKRRHTRRDDLLFATKALVVRRAHHVNARVVVVGASETSQGFLSELFRDLRHKTFTNVVLVSDDVPEDASCPLRYSVVRGAVTAVHYAEKRIALDSQSTVPYDYLVVCTGTEVALSDAFRMTGVFPMDSPSIIASAYAYIQTDVLQQPKSIVVVEGDSVRALAIFAELEQRGFPMQNAIWMYNSPHDWCDQDEDVVGRVRQVLGEQGIEMLTGHDVLRPESTTNRLQRIAIKGPATSKRMQVDADGAMHVNCAALLCSGKRQLSRRIRTAFAHDPVAVDRGIVVDGDFRTNDVFVYAGGPVAQISRKCGRRPVDLSKCCSREVGAMVARSLLRVVDPSTVLPVAGTPGDVPRFTQPKTDLLMLPGDGNVYFRSVLPGGIPVRFLKTDTAERLTKIGVDAIGRIVSMAVCGQVDVAFVEQLSRVVSLPVSFLNGADDRLAKDQIPDLIPFLTDHWATPILHDRLPSLIQLIRDKILERGPGDSNGLVGKVAELVSRSSSGIETGEIDALVRSLTVDDRSVVQNALLDHIVRHERHLPGLIWRRPTE